MGCVVVGKCCNADNCIYYYDVIILLHLLFVLQYTINFSAHMFALHTIRYSFMALYMMSWPYDVRFRFPIWLRKLHHIRMHSGGVSWWLFLWLLQATSLCDYICGLELQVVVLYANGSNRAKTVIICRKFLHVSRKIFERAIKNRQVNKTIKTFDIWWR